MLQLYFLSDLLKKKKPKKKQYINIYNLGSHGKSQSFAW